MDYIYWVAIALIANFAVFGTIALKKTKFTGIKDNSEYYQIRKEDDPDCRSYTNHSY